MKIGMTFLLLFFSMMPIYSQISETPITQEPIQKNWYPEIDTKTPDLAIYGTYGLQEYNRYSENWLVGLSVEMGFEDHWSANYRVQGGPGYIHFPLALPFAILSLGYSETTNSSYYGGNWLKYLFLIPEGVSYSFEIMPEFTIKPYVNPLGVTFLKESDAQNISYWEGYFMLSVGSSVQLTAMGTWGVSAYGEYRYAWGGKREGFQTGIRINHNFELGNRWPFFN